MITVTCAIIERNGKILIARRAEGQKLAGKWEFPGGKVEDGESPGECLKRELEEEFGIQSEVREFWGSGQEFGNTRPDQLLLHDKPWGQFSLFILLTTFDHRHLCHN